MKKFITIVVLFALFAAGSYTASAATNWTPSGTVTLLLGDKNFSPVLGTYRDEGYAFADVWVNLPADMAFQVSEYAGLNDSDLDSDKNDEFDLTLWKRFQLANGGYLKLRLKYFNIFPVSDLNRSDFVSYDVFVGKTVKVSDRSTLTPEFRVEYWHYLSSLNDGMFTILPGVTHSVTVGKVVAYQRLGLQWNEQFAPFGQLLSGQASAGFKTKVGNWSWTIVDASGALPFESADKGDPREQDGVISYTTSVSRSF